jgi:hypothetical protein
MLSGRWGIFIYKYIIKKANARILYDWCFGSMHAEFYSPVRYKTLGFSPMLLIRIRISFGRLDPDPLWEPDVVYRYRNTVRYLSDKNSNMQIQIQQGQILLRCLNKILLVQYTIGTYCTTASYWWNTVPYQSYANLACIFLKGGGGGSPRFRATLIIANCRFRIWRLKQAVPAM